MANISVANSLAPQAPANGVGVDMAALLGAGMEGAEGQFGLLLSQQLQQILTQAGLAEAPAGKGGGPVELAGQEHARLGRGVEASVDLIPVDALKPDQLVSGDLPLPVEDDVKQLIPRSDIAEMVKEEGGVRDLVRAQLEASGPNPPGLALGKKEDIADRDGKKLPENLPEDGKVQAVPMDQSAIAALAAAQIAPKPDFRQDARIEARPEFAAQSADSALAASKGLSAQEVAAIKPDARAQGASDILPASQQAAPQSFSALLTERSGAAGPQLPVMPTLEVPQRVDTPQWSSGVGDKVVWMLGSQTQGAELRLNPPALGPLEVRVSMNDGQATLTFMTPHAPVREAIEAAAPRLREMLSDSGISLGSVSVNVGTFAQHQQPGAQGERSGQGAAGQWATNFNDEDGAEASAMAVSASVRYLRDGGMVDLFA